ncbi:MAG: peptide chain release factor N(5)-glutamine methyltransferase [Firmicutes bacterium]|nr:peptide chain release factor N(5)-glutamine methyltransferase [Bacillota bacterium]
MNLTLLEVYKSGKSFLKEAFCELKSEFVIIFEDTFKVDKLNFFLNGNECPEALNVKIFFEKLKRLKNNEPVQYIVGSCSFLNLNLEVGPGVFIPRKDTEILIESIIDKFLSDNFERKRSLFENPICTKFNGNIIDLCSGSGAIALSLKNIFKNSNVTAVEIYNSAFSFLKSNSKKKDMNIDIILGDIFRILNDFENNFFDIIVSNPPYIRERDLEFLDATIKYEPEIALNGGEDGLVFFKKIIKNWTKKIKINGILAFEVGINQSRSVVSIMKNFGFKNIKIFNDFAGIERVVIGNRSV